MVHGEEEATRSLCYGRVRACVYVYLSVGMIRRIVVYAHHILHITLTIHILVVR